MIDRREVMSGAVLLATSAAITSVLMQAPESITPVPTVSGAADDPSAEARAKAAKAGPLPI
ncbi:hypothetical protein [Microvirga subterranea]|uniref:Uncharacterized protein n=1 Tax=Microvirga subterranea TaxID=186651 RepID=A0A370HCW9_9HYPH|nr:hypothetical protein [Microvirga subterranea]RDI55083.1 hypothetical protein DES45_11027 [Microvirga subterranea]